MELIYENGAGASVVLAGAESSAQSPYALTGAQGLYGVSAAVRLAEAGEESVWMSTCVKPRTIRLEGVMIGDCEANRPRLLACVTPLSPGWLTLRRDGCARRLRCHVTESPSFSKTDGTAFTAEMVAPSPYWEDAAGDTATPVSGWTGGVEFPLEITEGFEFGWRAIGVSVNLYNPGDVPAGLTLVIRAAGPVVNPQLLRTQSQEAIRLAITLEAGDELVVGTAVNGKHVSVLRSDGTRENGMPMLDPHSDFIMLMPGDNLLRASADSGEEAMEAAVTFRARYLCA